MTATSHIRLNTVAATQVLPAGTAHTLRRVHVLAAGSGAAAVTIRWDGPAGEIVAVIDGLTAPRQYDFDLDSQGRGLHVDNAGTTAADVVITWS